MENQPETKPDYFIQIPGKVLFEPRLSPGAKILYGDILFLNHNYGFCSQKNAYFAANYHVCVKTVNNWIHELKTLDLIKIELIRNQNKEVELRKIFALVQIDQPKGYETEETATQVANRECIVTADPAPKPQVPKPKKKVYGVNQNVFFTENEVAELLKKNHTGSVQSGSGTLQRLETEKQRKSKIGFCFHRLGCKGCLESFC